MISKDIKNNFPIFKKVSNLVYLDSAATSQTPEGVLKAMEEYYTGFRSNIHRGLYRMGEQATESYEGARRKIARFIGADEGEIVFTSGATDSSNMLIRSIEESLELREGDEIVTTVMEHHSTLIPLQKLAKRRKLVLKHISMTSDFHLDYREAEKLITPKTKIVSVILASNVLGTINDIKTIANLAHEVGALMVVDGTEAVGHISVDVKEFDADFLYFSGHKMLGPTGIGVLYGKKELLYKVEPSIFGGGIVEKVTLTDATWKRAPARFEAGTQNIAGAIGLGAAVEYLEEIGIQNIHKHVQELTEDAIKKLEKINGVKIFTQKNTKKNVGIVSFIIEGIHSHDIAEIAGRDDVAIRAGHHCAQPLIETLGVRATARASFYMYNSKNDIDRLVISIDRAHTMFLKTTID
ncbi:MAG: cysteine desulfurase [bacterium]|nr:cysteine desulfurase [bacterium]